MNRSSASPAVSGTARSRWYFATISASVGGQLLGNYTGVYEVAVTIDYSDTAAKISQEAFDAEYCSIFEAFYSETPPSLQRFKIT